MSSRKEAQESDEAFIERSNTSAVELAITTLKSLLLLNGGASVAMLGFVATVSSPQGNEVGATLNLAEVVVVLQLYAFGAALAVLATGAAYVVMYFQAAQVQSHVHVDEPPFVKSGKRTSALIKTHQTFHVFSIVFAVASIALFIIAVCQTGSIVAEAV